MDSHTNNKFKRNYAESDSSDNEEESTFPRFIIIESSSLPITPFIIEKAISSNLTPISVKKKIEKWNTTHRSEKEETCRFSTENDHVPQHSG